MEGERSPDAGQPLAVPTALLARHAVVVGASGSGKTRLAMHLLREQLRSGCSALVMDVKADSIRQALAYAEEAQLEPEQITVLWPREAGQGVPGWNPFAVETREVAAAVRRFVGLLSNLYKDGWGPRMDDIFKAAATVIAAQRLSILELVEFLRTPAYRDALLRQAEGSPAWERFREEHAYFRREFAEYTVANQQNQTQPVLNKIRGMITQPYLRALLTAREDTLDLPGLWRRQRLILVHLDAHELGPDGASLLSGLLAHQLLATAMQRSGPVPVVLMLDEMGMQERFLGSAVTDILAVARSQNLRLLAACQHLEQMSEGLKASLLTNTALRVFFRLGDQDAPRVARSLGLGTGSRPGRVSIEAPDAKAFEQTATMAYDLADPWDKPVYVSPDAWTRLQAAQARTGSSERVDSRLLDALAAIMDEALVSRVYVRAGKEERTEIGAFVRGLAGKEYALTGPDPLRLRIAFPYPKVKVVESQSETERTAEIARTLREMPVQEALLATDTGQKAHIRVLDVSFPKRLPDVARYLHSQGQSAKDIQQTSEGRWQRMEALASAAHIPLPTAEPERKGRQRETPAAPVPDVAPFQAPDTGNATSGTSQNGRAYPKPRNAPKEARPAKAAPRMRPTGMPARNAPTKPPLTTAAPAAPAQEVADDGSL